MSSDNIIVWWHIFVTVMIARLTFLPKNNNLIALRLQHKIARKISASLYNVTHATRKSEFSSNRLVGRGIMFIYEAARIEVVGMVSASRFDTFNESAPSIANFQFPFLRDWLIFLRSFRKRIIRMRLAEIDQVSRR